MSSKEYIESGIIETVIMGHGSHEEALELQLKRKQYPEVETYAAACEIWLEQMAQQQAVPAPAHNREVFLAFISNNQAGNDHVPADHTDAGGKVVSLLPKKRSFKWAAAASIVLLAGSGILNIYLYREFSKTKQAYEEVQAGNALLASQNAQYKNGITDLQHRNEIFVSPRVYKIALNGIAGKENYQATVFWNKETAETYLIVNNLPSPPPGKQYQLWALVDGQPVDAGVLSSCSELCKLSPVTQAQAFAITLEKAGGSVSPDLAQLYVTGKA